MQAVKTENIRKPRVSPIIGKICTYLVVVVMIVYCITLIFPVVWLIVNSLKSGTEYYLVSYFTLPKKPEFKNYGDVFRLLTHTITNEKGRLVYGIWDMTFYSFYYAILSSVYSVVTIIITGYAVGRYHDFWLSKVLFAVGLAWMLLPAVSDGGAMLLFKKRLGLYDNLTAWVLTSGGCIFTGQWFFVVVGYFRSMTKEYADAAYIDGASQFTVFIRIMVPLALPLMCLLFFLSFISAWNNYGTFLYYMPSYANLALGLYNWQFTAGLIGISTPQILAAFVVVSVPTVTLYLVSYKLIINNLNVGGLKG